MCSWIGGHLTTEPALWAPNQLLSTQSTIHFVFVQTRRGILLFKPRASSMARHDLGNFATRPFPGASSI